MLRVAFCAVAFLSRLAWGGLPDLSADTTCTVLEKEQPVCSGHLQGTYKIESQCLPNLSAVTVQYIFSYIFMQSLFCRISADDFGNKW